MATRTHLTLRGLLAKLTPQLGWVKTDLEYHAQQYERNGVTLIVLPTIEASRMLGVPPPIARLTNRALCQETLHKLWDGEIADRIKCPSARRKDDVLKAIATIQQGLRVLMCIKDLGTFEANAAWTAQQERLNAKLNKLQGYCKTE